MDHQNKEKLILGGKDYRTVRVNNKLWMAENLELLVKDSWFYMNNAVHGSAFGRLYTWHAALEACPEGWKLPSVDDWEELIDHFGGFAQAQQHLIKGGKSQIDIVYGGYRNIHGEFFSLERAADYWTSTAAGECNAWLFYLILNKEKVFKIIDDMRCGYSVRYIRELG